MSPRLPSLRAAAEESGRVLARFPAVLAAAVAAAVIGSRMVSAPTVPWLGAALAATTLALPLFIAATITAERARTPLLWPVLHGAALAVLIVFAQFWSHWPEAIQMRRYAQLSIAAHLLVAFLPYVRRDEPHGFWQWNRILFLRFLTAALFSGVLFVGLAIALAALDQLFKVKIASETYLRLWIWISFVFNTWFFLGGLPRDLAGLEERRDYPALIKVFAQFILIPLVAVYLAILTAYLGRILITGQWPKGWIGWLVSCVAAAGILSLLLVEPIREREENRWVATYTRWFYIALLPSIGMLLAAIWQRVDQYGITEDRYFLLVLALWLAAVAVAFIVRRDIGIRWIPVTLCALALVTMAGPWSAYDVALNSQLGRVRAILRRVGMLENGIARPASGPVPFETRRELSGVLTYLNKTHGPGAARRVLGSATAPAESSHVVERYGENERLAAAAMRALNVEYVNSWEGPNAGHFAFNGERGNVDIVEITGAHHHVHLQGPLPIQFVVEERAWELGFGGTPAALRLKRAGEVVLTVAADSLVERARRSLGFQSRFPQLRSETGGVMVSLIPRSYYGRIESDGPRLDSFDCDLYVGPAVSR